jgi:hypothetical protein
MRIVRRYRPDRESQIEALLLLLRSGGDTPDSPTTRVIPASESDRNVTEILDARAGLSVAGERKGPER